MWMNAFLAQLMVHGSTHSVQASWIPLLASFYQVPLTSSGGPLGPNLRWPHTDVLLHMVPIWSWETLMCSLLHYILGEQLFPKFQLSIQHQRPLQPISCSLDFSDTAHTTCPLCTRNSKGLILSSLSGLLEVFFLGHGVKSTAPTAPLGVKKPSSYILQSPANGPFIPLRWVGGFSATYFENACIFFQHLTLECAWAKISLLMSYYTHNSVNELMTPSPTGWVGRRP